MTIIMILKFTHLTYNALEVSPYKIFAILFTEFCDNPLPLSNGRVSVVATRTGQVAQYSCNDGFVLTGVSSRECSSIGKWRKSTPSCIRV